MIKITDSNGQALYLSAFTEAGVCSQWRGIRARVKVFDGTEIEASESAGQIAAAVEAQPAAQEKSVDENDSECEAPPIGWRCTRTRGHAGPCAAVASPEDIDRIAANAAQEGGAHG